MAQINNKKFEVCRWSFIKKDGIIYLTMLDSSSITFVVCRLSVIKSLIKKLNRTKQGLRTHTYVSIGHLHTCNESLRIEVCEQSERVYLWAHVGGNITTDLGSFKGDLCVYPRFNFKSTFQIDPDRVLSDYNFSWRLVDTFRSVVVNYGTE